MRFIIVIIQRIMCLSSPFLLVDIMTGMRIWNVLPREWHCCCCLLTSSWENSWSSLVTFLLEVMMMIEAAHEDLLGHKDLDQEDWQEKRGDRLKVANYCSIGSGASSLVILLLSFLGESLQLFLSCPKCCVFTLRQKTCEMCTFFVQFVCEKGVLHILYLIIGWSKGSWRRWLTSKDWLVQWSCENYNDKRVVVQALVVIFPSERESRRRDGLHEI